MRRKYYVFKGIVLLILGIAVLQYQANHYLRHHRAWVLDCIQKEWGFPASFDKVALSFDGLVLTHVTLLEVAEPLPFITIGKISFFPQWIPLLLEGKIKPGSVFLEQLSLRVDWRSKEGPSLLALNGASIPTSIDYELLKGFLDQKTIYLRDVSILWEFQNQVLNQQLDGSIQWVGSATQDWRFEGKHAITLATGLRLPEMTLKGQIQSDKQFAVQMGMRNLDVKADFYQQDDQWITKGCVSGHTVSIQDLKDYYTSAPTDPRLLQWFSEAFSKGMLQKIALNFEGPLQAPILQGHVDYQKVHFHYHNPWPAITEASGMIVIDKNNVSVHLTEGLLGDLPLQATYASIQWGGELKSALVKVQGSLQSTFEAGIAFLAHSPLEKDLARTLRMLSPQGPISLNLSLDIPLDDSKVAVKGLLQTQTATVEPFKGMLMDSVAGTFHFSESTLEAHDVHFRFFDKPQVATIGLAILPKTIQLDIKTDQSSAKLHINRSMMEQWSIVSSGMRGSIRWPTPTNNALVCTLDACHMDASLSDQGFRSDFLKAMDKPSVSFYCKDFYYQNRLLGELSFELSPQRNAYAIHTIALDHQHFSLIGEGLWSFHDQEPMTALKGTIVGVNIGKGLSDLGYDSALKESSGRLQYDAMWSGHPWNFDRERVKGSFDLKLDKGRILGVNPGLGRLMGLLNLESIKRRLQLDFSDVLKKGFVFDILQGTFKCDKGILSTEALMIDGPSAKINLQGNANLHSKAIDLRAQVQPHVGSGLPIAAAVAAGNPAIGAGVWLVNKLTGSGAMFKNRVTGNNYQVRGTWDEPVIESLSPAKPTKAAPQSPPDAKPGSAATPKK